MTPPPYGTCLWSHKSPRALTNGCTQCLRGFIGPSSTCQLLAGILMNMNVIEMSESNINQVSTVYQEVMHWFLFIYFPFCLVIRHYIGLVLVSHSPGEEGKVQGTLINKSKSKSILNPLLFARPTLKLIAFKRSLKSD